MTQQPSMTIDLDAWQPVIVTLRDGRRLSYYDFGDPDGTPCFYLPGTPCSGLAGAAYHDFAAQAGVRWISVDKPGYGRSDLSSGSLADFVGDLAELADHLTLPRFAVAGESGGGPYALATGWKLPERVSVVLVLAGMGPGHERWARAGMKPMNWVLVTLAQRAPALVWPLMRWMAWTATDPRRAARQAVAAAKRLPAPDRAVDDEFGHVERAAVADAFRDGVAGSLREARLLVRPWGFAIEDVSVPVELWHGTADVNVPIQLAENVCDRLPNCTSHFLSGVGHAAGHVAADDVMSAVVKHA